MTAGKTGARIVALVCVPGGGSTAAATFDARVPGHDDFSFRDGMAARGIETELIDLPGVLDPTVDGDSVTLGSAARAVAEAAAALRRRLPEGSVVVGVGHSLGGGVVTRAAAAFDGIALLGYSPFWSSLATTPDRPQASDADALVRWTRQTLAEQDSGLWASERVVFPLRLRDGFAILPDAPDEVAAAALAGAVPVPRGLAVQHGIVEPALAAAARVSGPVLLVFGGVDAAADPLAEARAYGAASAVETVVLAESGHAHHFSPARHRLWDELAAWVTTAVVPAPLERTTHV